MKNALHFIFTLALTLPVAHAQYTFTDLGALPGAGPTPLVYANGMNSAGDVCGSSSVLDTTHGFLWKPSMPNGAFGGMMDLGAVPHPTASNWSICTAVSLYAPVGYGYDPLDMLMSYRALVFSGGTFLGATATVPYVLPIPAPPPDFTPNSYAYAINDSGTIAGTWTAEPGIYHALVWRPASGDTFTVEDLNSPGFTGWVLQVASGVNKAGDVVGVGLFGGKTHAFLLKKGVLTDLGSLTPAPYDYAVATGLNDKGQVVGYSLVITPGGARHHAFLWSSGKMTDLGVPATPGALSGASLTRATTLTALALAPPPMTFQNSAAAAINNNGKIVGWANMAPTASTLYVKSPYGWGVAAAYDTNPRATAPGLATGWNILSMPSVTAGAPAPTAGALSALIAAFAINDNDQIAGTFIKSAGLLGTLNGGYLLTAPLPLKP